MRKSPIKHRVRPYKKDDGKNVQSYVRGDGQKANVNMAKPTITVKPSLNDVIAVMRERAKAQGAVSGDNQGYQGWTNHDTWNVMLLLENTQESDKWLSAWKQNFDKKIKGGRFNPVEAEKVVTNYLIPAAKGAKRFEWAVGKGFTADPDIDASKVNKAEIVLKILERE